MNDSSQPSVRSFREVDESDQKWGSDYIADILKAYDFPFISFNPGASFRGLAESIVNYNDNDPRVIQTPHEGLSVSIAHGFAKATNEPALCALHNVVGTLHGTMGIYNAYLDRVPLLILSGTGPMKKTERRPWIDWIHTGFVQGNLVREFVKWDDQPWHIGDVGDSIGRAHRIAETPPKGPTYVALDVEIQEEELEEPKDVPNLRPAVAPSGLDVGTEDLRKCARLLLEADLPVILTDQVGDSREAVSSLVELAELLGAPVIDIRWQRYNFPNTHPLDMTGSSVYTDADTLLLLDVWSENFLAYLTQETDSASNLTEAVSRDPTVIDIGTNDIEVSSFVQTSSLRDSDLSFVANTKHAIPALRDVVKDELAEREPPVRDNIETRKRAISERHRDLRDTWEKEAQEAWDESPVSTARLAGEIWNLIQGEQWVLVNGSLRGWARKLWEVDEFDQFIGTGSGGAGVGYGIGAAIGAALAYEQSDRIPINLQSDGDLMFYPSALWTIGHMELPIFTVVHNNRALYNSTAHRMEVANHRDRDDSHERAMIGTGYRDPTPDYASIAEAQGVTGYGPIEDPSELQPVLREAWETVINGKPVLVDVISQPR